MELVHDFTVPVRADQAFDLLLDVEKVAPCLPGAVVTSVDGDSFEGGMKIKLGPISMTFKGDGELEKNVEARTAVIHARGRDAKGNGGAQATVTASLEERDGVTDVHVVTDLNVSGKAAQFGGGVLRDVSNRMLAQFADNLSKLIQSGDVSAATGSAVRANGSPSPRADIEGLPTSGSPSAMAVSNDAGLDALGLLLGGSALTKLVRPTAIGFTCLVVGYLYGKNRTLERMMRGVR